MTEPTAHTESTWVEPVEEERSGGADVLLLVVLLVCTFATVSLMGFSPDDATWFDASPGAVSNPCGPLGATVARALFELLGYGAWLTALVLALTLWAIIGRPRVPLGRGFALAWLVAASLAMLHAGIGAEGPFPAGGQAGAWLSAQIVSALGAMGSWLVLVGSSGIAATVLFDIHWRSILSRPQARSSRRVREPAAVGWTMGEAVERASWGEITDLELVEPPHDATVAESQVEPTEVSVGPQGIGAVEYHRTDNTQHASVWPHLMRPVAAAQGGGLFRAGRPVTAEPELDIELEAAGQVGESEPEIVPLAPQPWPPPGRTSRRHRFRTAVANESKSAPPPPARLFNALPRPRAQGEQPHKDITRPVKRSLKRQAN